MSIDLLTPQLTQGATETSDEVIFLPAELQDLETTLTPSAEMGAYIVQRCLASCPIRRLTHQHPSQQMCAAEALGELPDTTTTEVMQGFDMLTQDCTRGLVAGRIMPIHQIRSQN